MAMWLQKIVLTVVAVVPIIVGEIVRVTDDAPAEDVVLVAPRPIPGFDALDPSLMPIAPMPDMVPALGGATSRPGC